MTEKDVLFRVKLNELQQRLTQKVTEDAKNVSDEDIQAYYEKNKKRSPSRSAVTSAWC
jgi:LPS O-antigen subunit length determinant protein (WzzB/FepE family)